jgi:hypothetical protein
MRRYLHMKKKILLGAVLVLILGLALFGCTSMSGIPKGSALLGVYEGSFNGKFDWGTIEFKFYQTPGGTKVFTGSFMEGAQFPANFTGRLVDGKIEGSLIGDLDGTLTGELSADGRSMSGTYKIADPPFDHGTWKAQRR